jgi:hypothetical protein
MVQLCIKDLKESNKYNLGKEFTINDRLTFKSKVYHKWVSESHRSLSLFFIRAFKLIPVFLKAFFVPLLLGLMLRLIEWPDAIYCRLNFSSSFGTPVYELCHHWEFNIYRISVPSSDIFESNRYVGDFEGFFILKNIWLILRAWFCWKDCSTLYQGFEVVKQIKSWEGVYFYMTDSISIP